MQKLIVIGTGALAREFTDWFAGDVDIIGYASNNATEHGEFGLKGAHYDGEIRPTDVGTDLAVVAIGSPATRARFHSQLSAVGFRFPSLVHSSSVVSAKAALGDGTIISPQCVVSPNVTLGTMVYVNFCCSIGHDCIVGDFVQINPGSHLGGFAKIGAGTTIGSGVAILQNVSVGTQTVIGSGSAVFATVADGVTVMGNPARRMPAFDKG
jgi:sugar O-acyltransferase (sialic acid O-acetyltransferase NeuD family)